MYKIDCVLITCEHGGNLVPPEFAPLFEGHEQLRTSHRGYDPGALELAKKLSASIDGEIYYSEITRLLIDLNRSARNHKVYSGVTRPLNPGQKNRLIRDYYLPYREKIEQTIQQQTDSGKSVLHISVHTFIPVLHGKVRKADIGLLYDPQRKTETNFCKIWREGLRKQFPLYKIRCNYPYLGKSDGLTTYFRKRFPGECYLGIELEINQKFVQEKAWHDIQHALITSLQQTLFTHSY